MVRSHAGEPNSWDVNSAVEGLFYTEKVGGSNPSRPTIDKHIHGWGYLATGRRGYPKEQACLPKARKRMCFSMVNV